MQDLLFHGRKLELRALRRADLHLAQAQAGPTDGQDLILLRLRDAPRAPKSVLEAARRVPEAVRQKGGEILDKNFRIQRIHNVSIICYYTVIDGICIKIGIQ